VQPFSTRVKGLLIWNPRSRRQRSLIRSATIRQGCLVYQAGSLSSFGFSQSALILVSSSTRLLEVGPKMRIGNAEDAESVVRKYFLGTRTFHGKIVSMFVEEKTEGPDEKGTWKVKGTYLTEGGVTAQFAATVSSRGEALITSSSSTKPKTQPGRSSVAHKLSSADYAARRRRRKKQRVRKRTKSSRNPS